MFSYQWLASYQFQVAGQAIKNAWTIRANSELQRGGEPRASERGAVGVSNIKSSVHDLAREPPP
jgi:hypothetical protein